MMGINVTKDELKDDWYLMASGSLFPFMVAYVVTANMQNKNLALLIKLVALILGGILSAKVIEQKNKSIQANALKSGGLDDSQTMDSIKVGDKGKDIEYLQNAINHLWNTDAIENTGVYSKETLPYVNTVFQGTSGHMNTDKGEVCKQLASDFVTIISNIVQLKEGEGE